MLVTNVILILGTQLMSPSVQSLGISLMHHETPSSWVKLWDSGPEDPVQWLKAVMQKTTALENWLEKVQSNSLFSRNLNLAELFHPDTFLNALRQQTARSSLIFHCIAPGKLQKRFVLMENVCCW